MLITNSFGTWNYIFQTLLVVTPDGSEAFLLPGISVFCAFLTGKGVSIIQKFISRHVEFYLASEHVKRSFTLHHCIRSAR